MGISLGKTYKNTRFEPGALQQAVIALAQSENLELSDIAVDVWYQHTNELSETKSLTVNDLGTIVAIAAPIQELTIYNTVLPLRPFYLAFESRGDGRLYVHVKARDGLRCKQAQATLADLLHLGPPDETETLYESTPLPEIPARTVSIPIAADVSTSAVPHSRPARLVPPETWTLRWLIDHTHVSFWVWLVALVVAGVLAVFTLGVRLADIPLIQRLFGKG